MIWVPKGHAVAPNGSSTAMANNARAAESRGLCRKTKAPIAHSEDDQRKHKGVVAELAEPRVGPDRHGDVARVIVAS